MDFQSIVVELVVCNFIRWIKRKGAEAQRTQRNDVCFVGATHFYYNMGRSYKNSALFASPRLCVRFFRSYALVTTALTMGMNMPMIDFFFCCITHINNMHIVVQGNACQGMIAINSDLIAIDFTYSNNHHCAIFRL